MTPEKLSLSTLDCSTVEAGPLLDVLVRETFFGGECYRGHRPSDDGWCCRDERNDRQCVPSYSTEWDAAIKMANLFSVWLVEKCNDNEYLGQVGNDAFDVGDVGPSPQIAIVHAALRYVSRHGLPERAKVKA